jgi:hypothetical protein
MIHLERQVSHFLPLLFCLSALLQGKQPLGIFGGLGSGFLFDRSFFKFGGWRKAMVDGLGTSFKSDGVEANMGCAILSVLCSIPLAAGSYMELLCSSFGAPSELPAASRYSVKFWMVGYN